MGENNWNHRASRYILITESRERGEIKVVRNTLYMTSFGAAVDVARRSATSRLWRDCGLRQIGVTATHLKEGQYLWRMNGHDAEGVYLNSDLDPACTCGGGPASDVDHSYQCPLSTIELMSKLKPPANLSDNDRFLSALDSALVNAMRNPGKAFESPEVSTWWLYCAMAIAEARVSQYFYTMEYVKAYKKPT